MPIFPEAGIVGPCHFGQHRIRIGIEPLDQPFKVVQIHRRAAGCAIMFPAPDMEENLVARIRHRIVVIVFDQHQPFVGGVAEMHVLLLPPSGIRRTGRQRIKVVIGEVGQLGIIDPRVMVGHLMVRPILRSFRQFRRITQHLANSEKACGIAMIAAQLLQAGLRGMKSPAPRQASLAEKHRPRVAIGLPLAGIVPMKKL